MDPSLATYLERLRSMAFAATVLCTAPGCSMMVDTFAFMPPATKEHVYVLGPSVDFSELRIQTDDDTELQAFLIDHGSPRRLVVYFHGNAETAYSRLVDAAMFSERGLDVLLVSYRGYGRSGGRPSERGVYRDGAAVMRYVMEHLHYASEDVYLLGRSIGSAVAVDIARRMDLGGVILLSPLSSGSEFLRQHGAPFLAPLLEGHFDSLGKVPDVREPMLFIHGEKDRLLEPRMSERLCEAARSTAKRLVIVEHADHNNVECVAGERYWDAIADFVGGTLSLRTDCRVTTWEADGRLAARCGND